MSYQDVFNEIQEKHQKRDSYSQTESRFRWSDIRILCACHPPWLELVNDSPTDICLVRCHEHRQLSDIQKKTLKITGP